MLQEEPIRLEEVTAVIQSMKHMPPAKRTSIMMGVLSVQLLLETRPDFDADDFAKTFDRLARSVSELRQDLAKKSS